MSSATKGGTIFFLVGEKSGRRSAQRRLTESTGSHEDALRRLESLKREQNWGDIEFSMLDLERKSGVINLKNCFDIPFKSGIGGCYFMRGFLAGFLSELLQDDASISNSANTSCNGSCTPMFWASGSENR